MFADTNTILTAPTRGKHGATQQLVIAASHDRAPVQPAGQLRGESGRPRVQPPGLAGTGFIDASLLVAPPSRKPSSRAATLSAFLFNEMASVELEPAVLAAKRLRRVPEDFLFGSAYARGPGVATSFSKRGSRMGMRPSSLDEMLQPHRAMLGTTMDLGSRLDPFRTSEDEEPTGYVKCVPRALRVFLTFDAAVALLLLGNLHAICDVPLKLWLAGVLFLGFPTSYLVTRMANTKPTYKYYRLVATRLRGGHDVADARWGGVQLFDGYDLPIPHQQVEEVEDTTDGSIWYATLESADLVSGYAIRTHESANPSNDPTGWTLEGSNDVFNWTVIDEMQSQEGVFLDFRVPTERQTWTAKIKRLAHLEDAHLSWRASFMLEMVFSVGSLAWLFAGTVWVNDGTYFCVDTAPWLWYPSFLMVTTAWSALFTGCFTIIVSAVAMLAMGAGGAGR